MGKKILILILLLVACSCFGENKKINSKIYRVNFVNSKYGIIYTEDGNGLIDVKGNLLNELKKDIEIEYLWDNIFIQKENENIKIINIEGKVFLNLVTKCEIKINKNLKKIIIKNGMDYSIYNNEIKKIINATGNSFSCLENGSFSLEKNSKTIIYDNNGKIIKKIDFKNISYDKYNDIYISQTLTDLYLVDKEGSKINSIKNATLLSTLKNYIILSINLEIYVYSIKENKFSHIESECKSNSYIGDRIVNNKLITDYRIYNLNNLEKEENKENVEYIYGSPAYIIGKTDEEVFIYDSDLNIVGTFKIDYKSFFFSDLQEGKNGLYSYSEFIYLLYDDKNFTVIKSNGEKIHLDKSLYIQNVNGYITNGYTLWDSDEKIIYSDDKAIIQSITSFKDSDFTTVVKDNQIGILNKKGNIRWIGEYTKVNNEFDVEKYLESLGGEGEEDF